MFCSSTSFVRILSFICTFLLLTAHASATHVPNARAARIRKLYGPRKRPSLRSAVAAEDYRPLSQGPRMNTFAHSSRSHYSRRASSVIRAGYTFDPCEKDSDCLSPRNCTKFTTKQVEKPCSFFNSTASCTCDWERDCEKRADCPEGEICAILELWETRSCLSEVAAIDKTEWVPLKNGLTLDSCEKKADCLGERNCFVDSRGWTKPCRKADKKCVCWKEKPDFCSSLGFSDGCDLGERCAAVRGQVFPQCASEQAVQAGKNVLAIGGALGMERCARKTDCAGDRVCLFDGSDNDPDAVIDFCAGRDDCFCANHSGGDCLKGNSKCFTGEICVKIKGGEIARCAATCIVLNQPDLVPVNATESIICASPSPSPSVVPLPVGSDELFPGSTQRPSPSVETVVENEQGPAEENPVTCVDAAALEHLDGPELVFEKDAWARVLCDENGSCATAGHIVYFMRKAMMMRSYCELVRCESQEMYVNSPRYRRGLRIGSKTKELEFTAFAARYATRTEEVLLATAVHVGL